MKKEVRTICYDDDLQLEAYRLEGIVQPFPNHFHEYYVIGYMVSGERFLSCRNREYTLRQDDIILFNPEDNHACAQSGDEPLHYLGINLAKPVMLKLVNEITGGKALPRFSSPVVSDQEIACTIQPLHDCMMRGSGEFEKEELFLLMMSLLLQRYCEPFEDHAADCRKEIEDTCDYMDRHYAEPISLEQLSMCAGLSKSALLRAFTKSKGITPYRYLQTVRVAKAKKLMEQGVSLIDTAMQTGFSDQSHFTKFFSMFIGLAPGVYRDIFRDKTVKGAPDENHP
jgi:AraC-like DNA-binding protein